MAGLRIEERLIYKESTKRIAIISIASSENINSRELSSLFEALIERWLITWVRAASQKIMGVKLERKSRDPGARGTISQFEKSRTDVRNHSQRPAIVR